MNATLSHQIRTSISHPISLSWILPLEALTLSTHRFHSRYDVLDLLLDPDVSDEGKSRKPTPLKTTSTRLHQSSGQANFNSMDITMNEDHQHHHHHHQSPLHYSTKNNNNNNNDNDDDNNEPDDEYDHDGYHHRRHDRIEDGDQFMNDREDIDKQMITDDHSHDLNMDSRRSHKPYYNTTLRRQKNYDSHSHNKSNVKNSIPSASSSPSSVVPSRRKPHSYHGKVNDSHHITSIESTSHRRIKKSYSYGHVPISSSSSSPSSSSSSSFGDKLMKKKSASNSTPLDSHTTPSFDALLLSSSSSVKRSSNESMTSNKNTIINPKKIPGIMGNLALSSCPGKKVRLNTGPVNGRAMINRDLETDLLRIKGFGVTAIVM